jgi:hypothetical protein
MYTARMRITREGHIERTDIWREGKWVDLWSVVHFFSGVIIGLLLYLLHFGPTASIALTLISLIAYEMWEMLVQIEETPNNRFMDVVTGMAGYLPAFFLLAPQLSYTTLATTLVLVLAGDSTLSFFGWRASQKAAELEKKLRARYLLQRAWLARHKTQLRDKYWR